MSEFYDHRIAVRRAIALLIFHTNVSKLPRKLRLGFTKKCSVKKKNLDCGWIVAKAISLKFDLQIF